MLVLPKIFPCENRMQNSDGKDLKHWMGTEKIEAFVLHIEGLFTLYKLGYGVTA